MKTKVEIKTIYRRNKCSTGYIDGYTNKSNFGANGFTVAIVVLDSGEIIEVPLDGLKVINSNL
jgi:hypothetical protein